jgi:hypothetical protein
MTTAVHSPSSTSKSAALLALALLACIPSGAGGQRLDRQKLLDAQTFWDNRDWDWDKANVPFFECPEADLTTTYYYRWELVTKHLTYGSPDSGYCFTEFIDRPLPPRVQRRGSGGEGRPVSIPRLLFKSAPH